MNRIYKRTEVSTFLVNEESVNAVRQTLRRKILDEKMSRYFTFDVEKRMVDGSFIYRFYLDIVYHEDDQSVLEKILRETSIEHQCVFMVNGYVYA